MARGYGQFCPVAKAAEIFCERWTALLLREFALGARRFSELQRGVPMMSPSMLSRRLKELEREGVIARVATDAGPGYALTEAGEEFVPIVQALGVWGQRWTRRELRPDEVDYRLLLWDMERTVRGGALGDGRTVVRLELTDLPRDYALWWFVNEGADVEVCLEDPGFEVDLYLAATVADMIHVWRGDVAVARALDDGRLEAHGPRALVRRLGDWLGLSPLAGVPPARPDPV